MGWSRWRARAAALAAAVLAAGPATGAEAAAPPRLLAAPSKPPGFTHVSVEQGLSHGSVQSILQDRAGYMWFATQDGLNRHDGTRIAVYRHDPSNEQSLAISNFGELLEDRSGALWFGTWGGGLDRYDPRSRLFTHHRHDPSDPSSLGHDRVETLLEDSRGRLWIGTELAGLDLYDPRAGRFRHFRHDERDATSLASDEVRALREDPDGGLWVGTNAGLSRLDPASGRFEHLRHDPSDPASLASDRVRAVLVDRAGALWVGTRGGGLARRARGGARFERFRHDPDDPASLSDDEVSCLFQDSSGTIWAGTYKGGLNRFEPASGSFARYQHDPRDPRSLASNYVEVIYEDRAQNLWVGTRGGGVDRLDLKPRKFASVPVAALVEKAVQPSGVRALAESLDPRDGGLWFATDGEGLVRYDRREARLERFRSRPGAAASLSSDRVWAVAVDRRGVVWAGTYDAGLNRLERRSGSYEVTRFPGARGAGPGLDDARIQAILEDGEGRLWLGTTRGLVEVVRGVSGEVEAFRSHRHDPANPNSLSDDYVSVLREDRAGALWLGTRGGLNRFEPATGRWLALRHRAGDEASLTHDGIHDVREDVREDGVLWVATEGGGLDRVDARSGRSRRHAIGARGAAGIVGAVLQDASGQLWLSTSTGLGRFDAGSGAFREYGRSDGIDNHSFLRGSSLASRDGALYFGGGNGTTSLVPALVRDNPHVPAVVLTSVRVFGEERLSADALAGLDAIELGHRDNFVSLEFAALDFTAPAENEYAYRLEGVDEGWVHVGSRNFANYTNLAPGRYTFRVKAANNDGVWNEQGTAVRVTVVPAPWQTWWFRAALLLGAGLVVALAHRQRVASVAARNRELQLMNAALAQEVDERTRAEAERERLIAELEARNTEMERFVYAVSHDLKSPIVTINGFVGLVERSLAEGDLATASRDLARVGGAAARMHTLLDELLQLLRNSRARSRPAAVELDAVVAEVVAQLAGAIEARAARVLVEPALPRVLGDRARLVEVVQNLVENAVKFTDAQPDPQVHVSCRRDDGYAVVCVADNGRGIEPRYFEKVFGLFERLDNATDGSGIGLALVKRIVEQHGGRVWVESDGADRGSRFYFSVPLADAAP